MSALECQSAAACHGLTDADRERRVDLGVSGSLVVRPVSRDDVEGLVALYDSLDDGDRYLRFFSLYRPPRSFFERMANAADRGGCQLVAVVGDDGVARIVGEAGYSPLPNGNGEFAITVHKEWRGWLGPFLLDALLAEASSRGIRYLEAEILRSNRSMLAVAKARGCVTVASVPKDWLSTHVMIATKPRVLARRTSRPAVFARHRTPAP